MASDPSLDGLRAALAVSPDNLPLRRMLADALLSRGHSVQAEAEYRKALLQTPDDTDLKLGLATTFFVQGKPGEAFVLVEDVIGEAPTAAAMLLLARLCLADGDTDRAAEAYREARRLDPDVAADDVARRLGTDVASEQDQTDAQHLENAAEELAAPTEFQRPRISFADVGGMESLKDEIRIKIIEPLRRPELFATYGKQAGGGILLYGPPGCGKTYLARATAGEIDIPFRSIGLNDVLDMYIGESERKLHELFQLARRTAPCVLFFDEVDALGASRTDMRQHA